MRAASDDRRSGAELQKHTDEVVEGVKSQMEEEYLSNIQQAQGAEASDHNQMRAFDIDQECSSDKHARSSVGAAYPSANARGINRTSSHGSIQANQHTPFSQKSQLPRLGSRMSSYEKISDKSTVEQKLDQE